MNRKVTVTYDLPEEICLVLEQRAATEGLRREDVVAEHVARCCPSHAPLTAQETQRRIAAFERHIGAFDSGDPRFSDNDRIDADLAKEYGSHDERGG
jgi:hypothetical protein